MPEIRDPVHGPISLSRSELRVVDNPVYQRLRSVKQLGFAEMVFPGATHNRYLHGLGAMHLAGRAFDSVFDEVPWMDGADRVRLRQTVRLGALLHDVGHPPLSHTLESILPHLSEVPLDHSGECPDRQASHEDMTLTLITKSDLSDVIREAFASEGISPEAVAGLVSRDLPVESGAYSVGSRNLRPLLSQLVSSEIDVDRMDYLLRDAFFTGTTYGRFDRDWLLGSLTYHEDGSENVSLALHGRAIYSFEDFLLSRYHMFLMVYFHQRTNAYDRMLLRFFDTLEPAVVLPGDAAGYLLWDDSAIQAILRENSENVWAQRILSRRPIRRVLDLKGDRVAELQPLVEDQLKSAGIAAEWMTSKGVLSKYHGKRDDPMSRIHVAFDSHSGREGTLPLEQATGLFSRYRDPTILLRLYTVDTDVDRARKLVMEVLRDSESLDLLA